MDRTPVKILLVDDERDFVEMLSLRLQDTGDEVTAAYSGKECLDILKRGQVDVVILDIKMPGMDGIQTLGEIKKRFPLVEVILLTGHGSLDTAIEGMKAGAFDYLMKPADFEEVRRKIEEAKQRKEKQEARIRRAEKGLYTM